LSVEAKGNGSLRLRCDVDDCDRKFIPRRRLLDATQLRLRAQLYGWRQTRGISFVFKSNLQPLPVDRCPTCAKETP
jgi:hypothetical protein